VGGNERFEAPLSDAGKQAFVDTLAREHGQRLKSFLAARLRQAVADVPDLVQEVYLRLLRVPRHESIRSPRAYLFTVALHVLHQHKLSLSATARDVDVTELLPELETRAGDNPAAHVETVAEIEAFDEMLSELPVQTYTVFVLHRQCGYTREEIAERLGLSQAMVKKHLTLALIHCRRRYGEME
jgi:RNA polymerase sigma factor (sigma-70 family)